MRFRRLAGIGSHNSHFFLLHQSKRLTRTRPDPNPSTPNLTCNNHGRTDSLAVWPPRKDPMAISDSQLAANRANAQRSIGPRTEAGKNASRLNAFRHRI